MPAPSRDTAAGQACPGLCPAPEFSLVPASLGFWLNLSAAVSSSISLKAGRVNFVKTKLKPTGLTALGPFPTQGNGASPESRVPLQSPGPSRWARPCLFHLYFQV